MDIPFTTKPRPDTDLYNAKVGMWLFLASEVMLFGGLFSAYIFLRVGAPAVQATASCFISPDGGLRAGFDAMGPTKPLGAASA